MGSGKVRSEWAVRAQVSARRGALWVALRMNFHAGIFQ